MDSRLRLTKNDSADIAFVKLCLMSGAISQDELREWLYHVIEHYDDIPTYFFDLLDAKDLREMFRGANGPIGFFTSSDLSEIESDALTGIAYKRGFYDGPLGYDVHIERDEALKALQQNPHIEKRFCEMFPFIKH